MVVLEWSELARLFVSCLTCWTLLQLGAREVRTHKQPPGVKNFTSTQPVTAGQKVLTIEGRECKFPFRLGGKLYHQCITLSSGRRWCSLTNNFDRDMKWGYCSSRTRLFNSKENSLSLLTYTKQRKDRITQCTNMNAVVGIYAFHSISTHNLCNPNPCKNGGACTAVPYRRSFQCVCPDAFTGANCEMKKCYEPLHLKHYGIGEVWGRIHLRNVEQCTCGRDGMSCKPTRYRECLTNPCENEGTCRVIKTTREAVCACRPGYRGPYCNISPDEKCYKESGVQYRGTANTTLSGAPCLPWSSDLMYNELSVDTVNDASQRGLGDHAFCRNPDNDKKPWCYTMNNGVISWEYCEVLSCSKVLTSRKAPIPTSLPTPVARLKSTCGRSQPKRVPRGRILGGTSAMAGSHPWMAALYIGNEFCAGSLISSCWIVSAAHCFLRNPLLSAVRVVLGQHVFNDSSSNTQVHSIEKCFFYEQYNQFSPTVHDIEGNSYSALTEGNVRLIPDEKCSSPEVYGSEVREGMLCAGSNSCVDACQRVRRLSAAPPVILKGDPQLFRSHERRKMTDSSVAEGHVKVRDGKKANCLVLLVSKERGVKERSSVVLEHICGLEAGESSEGVAYVLTILSLNQIVQLGFDSKEALLAWDLRLRYYLGEVHSFKVTVLPGTKLETGPSTLHLCNNLLVISRDVPPVISGQWNLLDLRRYGPVPNGFVFEGGTRCGYWAGVFFVSSAEGEQISFLFDCIVRGISPSRGPFGIKPLLPEPSTSAESAEQRLNQEAEALEKRLSLLSHNTASSSSFSSSVTGDDRSISGSSDSETSQSDSSIGSRLTLWVEPVPTITAESAKKTSLGAEKLINPAKGPKLPAKPTLSRRLQEVGRQSSSDSGIATESHSSYSGSFSSYTGSLDTESPREEYGTLLSLPPFSSHKKQQCTCPVSHTHEYQVPSSLRYLYDTPRSLLEEVRDQKDATTSKQTQEAVKGQTEAMAGACSVSESPRDSVSQGSSSTDTHSDCLICCPHLTSSRMLFTTCPICGGLKESAGTQEYFQFVQYRSASSWKLTAETPSENKNKTFLDTVTFQPSLHLSNGETAVGDKKQRSHEERRRMDPAYEFMEGPATDRSLESDDKSRYEPMSSSGQQRGIDESGDDSGLSQRPKGGVTYVNIPVSPTPKKQLHYMELELQEHSGTVLGKGTTKYAQIDITATETAHRVGTQHALGREAGLQKLEQWKKGGAP
ncbi:Protein Dok-7 [Bagarius yarrelli]|uniref:Protein Dok-7 n=1 Tax=Bagarius yarrelli TaxID=175774 RepID=A0A556V7X7_BAGYA|nr:Protein Dok-7 [Bagarius yarrelli]